jgi:hypothetical protein
MGIQIAIEPEPIYHTNDPNVIEMNAGQIESVVLAALWLVLSACRAESSKAALTATGKSKEVAPGVLQIGRINHPRITESSGIVASRQYPGVFWTHNDGGGFKKQILYGIKREGKFVAEFRVGGVLLHDWEDIAIDSEGHLFVGDIGNNNGLRKQLAVYEIDEPDPKSSRTAVEVKRGWQLRFPQAPFDCESLFVWQHYGYLISKVFDNQRAEIYRFPLSEQKEPVVLELVVRLKIDSPVTGADISADGDLLGLVTKSGAFVYQIKGDVARAARKKPWQTKFSHQHIEACCFVPEGLLATAESREIYLFTDEPFHPGK